jgi:poly-gamma-glutamate synthesis protein (capsule biosynthesis protein)
VVLGIALATLVMACNPENKSAPGSIASAPGSITNAPGTITSAPQAPSTIPAAAPSDAGPGPAARRDRLVVIAGGDVFFGRGHGQILLRDPEHDPFRTVQALFATADVRFANLESQLSDQKGETGHPENKLIFTGPPSGADALRRGGMTIVSTANNHMWDYGKAALFETMDNLDRVGVLYVGSGRTRERAYGPVIVEREGFRVAFLAVTDIWNQGPLRVHPGRELVAMAEAEPLAQAVRALRADPTVDTIIVSYHGGSEYMEEPMQTTRAIVHAAVDAGADVIVGHHPHVVQGIGWYRGKPILYSLGNFTMGMHQDHAWSQMGYLARITLRRGAAAEIEACPYRLRGFEPVPLAGDPQRPHYEKHFFTKFERISRQVAGTTIGPVGSDGCAPVTPPARPFPGAIP